MRIQSRNSRSASVARPSQLSILDRSSIHSLWYAHSAFSSTKYPIPTHIFVPSGKRREISTTTQSDLAIARNHFSAFAFGNFPGCTPSPAMDKPTFERPSQAFASPITHKQCLLPDRLHGPSQPSRPPWKEGEAEKGETQEQE